MTTQKTRQPKMTKEKILQTLFNKMFEIAGHNITYEDIMEYDARCKQDPTIIPFYNNWTMTESQMVEFKKWGVAFLKKQKYLKPDIEMSGFILMWGLQTTD